MADTHSHGNYYKVLSVSESATMDDIKRAFRTLAKKHHPDMGGSVVEMHHVSRAYEVLSDPVTRAAYDKTLHLPQPESTQHSQQTPHTTHTPPKPHQPSAAELLAEEKQMVASIKKAGTRTLLIGIGIAVLGLIITGIGYNMAEAGGGYTVMYGLVLWGGFLIIKGWYNLLTPYAALHKALDTSASVYSFSLEKKSSPGRAVGIIAVSVVGIIVLLMILSSSGSSSSTTAPARNSGSGSSAQSTSLKATYDSCIANYNDLESALTTVESQMATYDRNGDTSSYNALVPQQNLLVNQANSKNDECETDRTAYNNSL